MITIKKIVFLMIILIAVSACKTKKKITEVSDKKSKQETKASKEPEIYRDEDVQMREEARDRESSNPTAINLKLKREQQLSSYFKAIASSPSVASANNSIEEALGMFSSPETPVLIIIHRSGASVDYDKPTSIKEYFNYIKDQKKNDNTIESIELDNSGKIKSVELMKEKNY